MSELSMTDKRWRHERYRLQNSPYFCVSNTCEQSNKSSGARLKTESETGERLPTGVWGSRASRVLDSGPTPKWFCEKTDCFAVYEQCKGGLGGIGLSLLRVNSNFVKLYFKMPDNSTLNKKTKNYSSIPKITVLMNPRWGTKATSGVSTLCCCFHWSVSVNTAHGILLDPLLQRLKWCSAGPTLRSRSLPVWIPSRICVRCFSSPGWWMRKVSVFKLL